jgi:hypothetical protein
MWFAFAKKKRKTIDTSLYVTVEIQTAVCHPLLSNTSHAISILLLSSLKRNLLLRCCMGLCLVSLQSVLAKYARDT